MISRYKQLKEALAASTLSINTYVESLNRFNNILKDSKFKNSQNKAANLKVQTQSQLLTLCLIKDIQRKKVIVLNNILRQGYLKESDKFLILKLNLENINCEDISKVISIKINLNNYAEISKLNKFLTVKLSLDNKGSSAKAKKKVVYLRFRVRSY